MVVLYVLVSGLAVQEAFGAEPAVQHLDSKVLFQEMLGKSLFRHELKIASLVATGQGSFKLGKGAQDVTS